MLLRSHREDPVEREPIFLWPGTELSRFHLHGLKVVTEGHHDFTSFASFDGIHRSESRINRLRTEGMQRIVGAHRQTTLMLLVVELAMLTAQQ